MSKKKRNHNTRLIQQNRSYRFYEIAKLFGTHQNVIPRWVKDGLRLIDDQKPPMVHGSDLADYLKTKQKGRKRPCKTGELFCCTCHKPQSVWEGAVDLIIRNEKTLYLIGLCVICNGKIRQIGSVQKIPEYQRIFNVLKIE